MAPNLMFTSSLASLFLLLLLSAIHIGNATNDTEALISFMFHTDAHGNLRQNWTSGDACSGRWDGVHCMFGRVTALSLPFLDLRGSIESLRSLDQLRYLDLHSNRLNGSLSSLSSCINLRFVYLSDNEFSGEIPGGLSSLTRLLRVDLSRNKLRGEIPMGFLNLTRIVTLRLENNVLTGPVLGFLASLVRLRELNLSNNEFYGEVPESMVMKFGLASFAGNSRLCGRDPPLPRCFFTKPSPFPSFQPNIVPSNPGAMPGSASSASSATSGLHAAKSREGLNSRAIVGIAVGDAVVFLLLVLLFWMCYSKRCRTHQGDADTGEKRARGELSSFDNGAYDQTTPDEEEGEGEMSERSKLVFFDRRRHFALEDLLRASAEMLGKGSLGTVYKAVLEDGSVVAVKRLKEAHPSSRKEFERYMDMIGRMRHPNIVRLKAYYYAKDEKLLVYDFLPNGTLHSLLHGNRGPGRTPLDWTTRISLALGAARGLARIHEEFSSAGIPHGNVKSTNVLLDKNGIACVADFGLALLLNPVQATSRLGGYAAPEQMETKKLSHKSDVYSFGVLLLELLTGRVPQAGRNWPAAEGGGVDLPKWVQSIVREEWTAEVFDVELLRYKNIEEELVAMLQIGLACVSAPPEARPSMVQVVKMIEDIRAEQSPLRGDDWDHHSRNSVSSPITEEGIGSY